MAEPTATGGKLKTRLDRLEASSVEINNKVSALQRVQTDSPEAARAEQIEELTRQGTELRDAIKIIRDHVEAIREGKEIEPQIQADGGGPLWGFYFGGDSHDTVLARNVRPVDPDTPTPSDGND